MNASVLVQQVLRSFFECFATQFDLQHMAYDDFMISSHKTLLLWKMFSFVLLLRNQETINIICFLAFNEGFYTLECVKVK